MIFGGGDFFVHEERFCLESGSPERRYYVSRLGRFVGRFYHPFGRCLCGFVEPRSAPPLSVL